MQKFAMWKIDQALLFDLNKQCAIAIKLMRSYEINDAFWKYVEVYPSWVVSDGFILTRRDDVGFVE